MSWTQFSYLFIFIFIGGFAWAGLKGAPWVPTRKKDLDYILDNINIPQDAVVYDLGSGDGRAVFRFAKHKNIIRSVGYELAWPLFLLSIIKKLFIDSKISSKVKFELKNLEKAKIETADIIFCFLMPETIAKIFPELFKKMKPSAQFISAVFEVKSCAPTKVIKKSATDCSYYLYIK